MRPWLAVVVALAATSSCEDPDVKAWRRSLARPVTEKTASRQLRDCKAIGYTFHFDDLKARCRELAPRIAAVSDCMDGCDALLLADRSSPAWAAARAAVAEHCAKQLTPEFCTALLR